MIQINLVPDIKQAFLKARRKQRIISFVSFIVASVTAGIFIITAILTFAVQRSQINSLQSSITTNLKKLQNTEDLDKILTIQNQLLKIDELHTSKPVASRLFTYKTDNQEIAGYLSQLVPSNISVSTFEVTFDSSKQAVFIKGKANTFDDINRFADTLKFAEYQPNKDSKDKKLVFSGVRLESYVVAANEQPAFTINAVYDPAIFSANGVGVISVPNRETTRSVTERPTFIEESKTSQPEVKK